MSSARAHRLAFTSILAACPSSASAVISTFWTDVPIPPAAVSSDPVLANMRCFSLSVTTTGDWGSAGFEAILPAGNFFYQHPFGSNTRPNPALVAVFPALAFDTYVTAPSDTGTSGLPIILGQFPPAGSADFGGSSGRFSVLWGDLLPDAPGTYEILRLTFPMGVLPSVNQFSFTTQSNPTASGGAGNNLEGGQSYPLKLWLPDADGDWNDPSNWSNGLLPTLRQRVLLDVGGPTLRTITHASGNTQLHELRSFERIVLSGGTLSTYVTEINGELLLSGGTFRPQGLNHLTGSGVVDVSTGGSIVIGDSSALAVGSGLTLRGTGGVVSGGIIFNNGGRIVAEGPADVLPIQGTFVSLQSGEIGGDGAVRVTGSIAVQGSNTKSGSGPLRATGSFSISGNSTLDLAGGSIVNDYTGSTPFNEIRANIISGYNNGSWNGTGINSSTAAGDPSFAVGYAEASELFTSFPATFMGETIDETTVLVRLVRSGDADLNGTVGLDDFNRLAANFGSSGVFWDDGDFNYDGVTNLTDFNLLASNFGLSAGPDGVVDPQDWAALASAVPEPGTLALTGVAALAAMLRPRMRCHSMTKS